MKIYQCDHSESNLEMAILNVILFVCNDASLAFVSFMMHSNPSKQRSKKISLVALHPSGDIFGSAA